MVSFVMVLIIEKDPINVVSEMVNARCQINSFSSSIILNPHVSPLTQSNSVSVVLYSIPAGK